MKISYRVALLLISACVGNVIWRILPPRRIDFDKLHQFILDHIHYNKSFEQIVNSHSMKNEHKKGLTERSPENVDNISHIPRVFHQIWKTEYIPKTFVPWIQGWNHHHPEWKYILWTHESSEKFISKRFPDYLPLFKSYSFDIYRADAIRYFILLYFGGFYVDLDIECLRPVEKLLQEHLCIVSQEPHLHVSVLLKRTQRFASNALMACRPYHPFYKLIIDNLHTNSKKNTLSSATGPMMIETMTEVYLNTTKHRPPTDDLYVAPAGFFMPTFDRNPMGIGTFPSACKKLIKKFSNHSSPFTMDELSVKQYTDCKWLASRNYTNTPRDHSYSDHHWIHTYFHDHIYHGRPGNDTSHITDIIPNVILGSDLLKVSSSSPKIPS